MLRHLDLFSGIGGFSLAAQWAGIETVAFCEPEPFCRRVLKKHWPQVPIFYDVRRLNGQKINQRYGPIDVITGGFPCQPFSFAGKRRGKEDDRSLWKEMFRIIKQVRPSWVLGENVAGIINMELDNVLSDLESEGYTTQAFVIPACAVDAKHRRDRVWIAAYSNKNHESNSTINDKTREHVANSRHCKQGCKINGFDKKQINHNEKIKRTTSWDRSSNSCQDVANSNINGLQGKREESNTARQTGLCDRKTRRAEIARTTQSGLGKRFDGVPAEMDRGGLDGSNKILHDMLQKVRAEILWEQIRGFENIQEEKILRTGLHGESLCQRCAIKIGIIKTGKEIPWKELRMLWGYEEASITPHRREQTKQLAKKYPDLMHQLSRYTSPPCTTCWSDDSWENGIPRIIRSCANRTKRLKALGNAIVPQVAYPILKAIVESNNA